MTTVPTRESGSTRTARWPQAGRGQKWLLGASLLIVVGSFLPWVTFGTLATINGLQTAGLWTFYLGTLGIAGALVPWRSVAIAQGAIAAVAALALPAWQMWHLYSTDLDGWQPGIGALICVAGGSLAARAVILLVSGRGRDA